LLLLSGTLLPMSLAPGWLQALSDLNPLEHVVEGDRAFFDRLVGRRPDRGDGRGWAGGSACDVSARSRVDRMSITCHPMACLAGAFVGGSA
jgi:hypothetical protein